MTYGSNLFSAYYNAQLTARSYIQNGLVNQWDGIENVGYGMHDSNATAWRDLISGVDATRHSNTNPVVWSDNCWTSTDTYTNQSFDCTLDSSIVKNSNITFEVLTMRKGTNRGTICGQFGIPPNSQGMNIENYNNRNIRAYWNSTPDQQTSAGVYPVNTICYFAVLADGNSRIIYKGGGAKWTSTGSWLLSNSVWCIGCDGRHSTMNFYGNIYAFRVYNRTLSDAELESNYAIDKIRFNIQ